MAGTAPAELNRSGLPALRGSARGGAARVAEGIRNHDDRVVEEAATNALRVHLEKAGLEEVDIEVQFKRPVLLKREDDWS